VLNHPQMVHYLQCLRMCQVAGTKLGHRHLPYGGHVCVAYVVDGQVWEFCKGTVMNREPYVSSNWRLSVGERQDLRRLRTTPCN